MIWVFVYLGVGLFGVTIFLCRPGKIMEDGGLIAAAVVIILMGPFWPVGFSLMIAGRVSQYLPKRNPTAARSVPFKVRLRDLRATMTIEDIETQERVIDPLAAVPDLPFGHLNPGWERFKAGLSPGTRVCSFSRTYGKHYVERYDGYAEVSPKALIGWFVTRVRPTSN